MAQPPAHLRSVEAAQLSDPWLAEDSVHYFRALGERRPDLVAVDRLGRSRAFMTGEQRDALDWNAVGGQHRYEGVSHLPGHPVLAEARLLGDYAERADHVVRRQGRTD